MAKIRDFSVLFLLFISFCWYAGVDFFTPSPGNALILGIGLVSASITTLFLTLARNAGLDIESAKSRVASADYSNIGAKPDCQHCQELEGRLEFLVRSYENIVKSPLSVAEPTVDPTWTVNTTWRVAEPTVDPTWRVATCDTPNTSPPQKVKRPRAKRPLPNKK